MAGLRFDRLTDLVESVATRRLLVGGLAARLFGDAPWTAAKPRRNGFGCLDVGKRCDGRHRRCCSGLCRGNRKKQGKKDKSRCIAHHTGSCPSDADACTGVDVDCGSGGLCYRTTGKSSFCGGDLTCMVCRNDRECQSMLGKGAACVVCQSCVDIDGSRTACVPPRA